jgi:hypothetical protein
MSPLALPEDRWGPVAVRLRVSFGHRSASQHCRARPDGREATSIGFPHRSDPDHSEGAFPSYVFTADRGQHCCRTADPLRKLPVPYWTLT